MTGQDPAAAGSPARRSPSPGPGRGAGPGGYLSMPVGGFLAALSAPRPDPGGGAAAALTVTLAASLCAMSARLSQRRLPAAARLAEEAELLRDRAAPLAQADVAGYQAVLDALRGRPDPGSGPDPGAGSGQADGPGERGRRVAAALSQASAVPLAVAQIGAQVAALAATCAEDGNPAIRGDAVASAVLAAAAARAAAALVRINLAGLADDRPGRADALAAEAAAHADRAERAAGGRRPA